MSHPIFTRLSRLIPMLNFWNSSFINNPRLYKILGLIFFGMISRFVPHPPNFVAINAIALFGICSFGSIRTSFFSIFSVMLLSDVFFGFHSRMFFVYLSYGLIVLMGRWLSPKKSLIRTAALLIASSFLFFIITNFGVWLNDTLYPKNIVGLQICYLAAVPFFVNNVLGSLFYGMVLHGLFALSEQKSFQRVTV